MLHMPKKCGKNASDTLDLVIYFDFEQASYETCLSYKIFMWLVLELVCYSFFQITRGKFVGK